MKKTKLISLLGSFSDQRTDLLMSVQGKQAQKVIVQGSNCSSILMKTWKGSQKEDTPLRARARMFLTFSEFMSRE